VLLFCFRASSRGHTRSAAKPSGVGASFVSKIIGDLPARGIAKPRVHAPPSAKSLAAISELVQPQTSRASPITMPDKDKKAPAKMRRKAGGM
jgi:hypothetical protein